MGYWMQGLPHHHSYQPNEQPHHPDPNSWHPLRHSVRPDFSRDDLFRDFTSVYTSEHEHVGASSSKKSSNVRYQELRPAPKRAGNPVTSKRKSPSTSNKTQSSSSSRKDNSTSEPVKITYVIPEDSDSEPSVERLSTSMATFKGKSRTSNPQERSNSSRSGSSNDSLASYSPNTSYMISKIGDSVPKVGGAGQTSSSPQRPIPSRPVASKAAPANVPAKFTYMIPETSHTAFRQVPGAAEALANMHRKNALLQLKHVQISISPKYMPQSASSKHNSKKALQPSRPQQKTRTQGGPHSANHPLPQPSASPPVRHELQKGFVHHHMNLKTIRDTIPRLVPPERTRKRHGIQKQSCPSKLVPLDVGTSVEEVVDNWIAEMSSEQESSTQTQIDSSLLPELLPVKSGGESFLFGEVLGDFGDMVAGSGNTTYLSASQTPAVQDSSLQGQAASSGPAPAPVMAGVVLPPSAPPARNTGPSVVPVVGNGSPVPAVPIVDVERSPPVPIAGVERLEEQEVMIKKECGLSPDSSSQALAGWPSQSVAHPSNHLLPLLTEVQGGLLVPISPSSAVTTTSEATSGSLTATTGSTTVVTAAIMSGAVTVSVRGVATTGGATTTATAATHTPISSVAGCISTPETTAHTSIASPLSSTHNENFTPLTSHHMAGGELELLQREIEAETVRLKALEPNAVKERGRSDTDNSDSRVALFGTEETFSTAPSPSNSSNTTSTDNTSSTEISGVVDIAMQRDKHLSDSGTLSPQPLLPSSPPLTPQASFSHSKCSPSSVLLESIISGLRTRTQHAGEKKSSRLEASSGSKSPHKGRVKLNPQKRKRTSSTSTCAVESVRQGGKGGKGGEKPRRKRKKGGGRREGGEGEEKRVDATQPEPKRHKPFPLPLELPPSSPVMQVHTYATT